MTQVREDDPPSPSHLGQPSSAVHLSARATNTVPVEPYRDNPDAEYSTEDYDDEDDDDDNDNDGDDDDNDGGNHGGKNRSSAPSSSSSSPSSPAARHRRRRRRRLHAHAHDPPPLYQDDPHGVPQSINPLLPAASQLLPDGTPLPAPHHVDADTGHEYYLSRRLDTDAVHLEHTIRQLCLFPPRPHVRLRGTHHESAGRHEAKDKNGAAQSRLVTDFDVRVDLTPFLYRDIHRLNAWRSISTAHNLDKVRRGTVWRTRALGYGGSGPRAAVEDGTPDLAEWCERYVALPRRLKTLLVRRRVVGLDVDRLRTRLEDMVRATQYRGSLAVTFPVVGECVEVRSDVWENRWRLIPWVRFLFCATLLFVFALPYLFFRTARFEVVNVDWAFSRPVPTPVPDGLARTWLTEYVSISEEAWYNMWARAIQRAVLARRQSVLDQADLRAAEEAEGPTFASGEGLEGLVRAGMNAMSVVDRQYGWGYDRA